MVSHRCSDHETKEKCVLVLQSCVSPAGTGNHTKDTGDPGQAAAASCSVRTDTDRNILEAECKRCCSEYLDQVEAACDAEEIELVCWRTLRNGRRGSRKAKRSAMCDAAEIEPGSENFEDQKMGKEAEGCDPIAEKLKDPLAFKYTLRETPSQSPCCTRRPKYWQRRLCRSDTRQKKGA